jgi:hypothetical protein
MKLKELLEAIKNQNPESEIFLAAGKFPCDCQYQDDCQCQTYDQFLEIKFGTCSPKNKEVYNTKQTNLMQQEIIPMLADDIIPAMFFIPKIEK